MTKKIPNKIRNRDVAAAGSTGERSKLVDLKDKQEKAARKAQEAAINKKNAEVASIKQAVANVAKTLDGRLFLRMLRNSCGGDGFHVMMNPNTGEINKDLLMVNDSKRDLWLEIRQLIPVKELIAIEHNVDKVVELAE